jgi:hypothetical protein
MGHPAAQTGNVDRMSTGPHDLAGWLRSQPDDALARLLSLRPDLLHPVPPDVAVLAARATGRASVEVALDRLDLGALEVLDVVTGMAEPLDLPSAIESVIVVGATDPGAVGEVLDRLRAAALVWGPDDAMRVAPVAREVLARGNPWSSPLTGPSVASLLVDLPAAQLEFIVADLTALPGVRRPKAPADMSATITAILTDPVQLAAVLAGVPAAAREVLDLLAKGPPVGRVPAARRPVMASTADSPVRWLIAHGLIIAVDDTTVVLPREIGIALRGEQPTPPALTPPNLAITAIKPADADAAAAGQAFAVVRLVETLLERWGIDPPGVLRAGGLGVRDLRTSARELDVEEPVAALLIEIAHAAGLIAPDPETAEAWLPTLGYDLWLAQPIARRWAALAAAWLTTTRAPGLVGRKEQQPDGGKAGSAPNALGPDVDRALAPTVRRELLKLLAEQPAGSAPSRETVILRVRWSSPRRGGRLRDDLVEWSLVEAEHLGITGRGALSSFGAALAELVLESAADDEADPVSIAADILEPLLPEALDHVLLQADLTAIAPGPLESDFARELGLAADIESTGGATVYRFSEGSIRRALDSGRSAADLHALFAARSRTPVPQPLSYLVDDVARRHGRIRIGAASAYVRCDDDAVLAELIADRRAQSLRLHRLAPSVLISQLAPDRVADRLREMGYAPAAENPDGAILLRRPDARRAPNRPRPPRRRPEFGSPDDAVIGVAVKAIRGGDRAATAIRQPAVGTAASGVLPRSASRDTLALLQSAMEAGSPLWIGYLNQQGQASNRIVEPIRLAGGYLTAFDHRHDEVRTFAIHRITGVATVELDDADVPG